MKRIFDVKRVLGLQDVFPFSRELVTRLSHVLVLSEQSVEFIQLSYSEVEQENERFEIEGVHHVFCDLLEKLELCLKKLESQLGLVNKERGESIVHYWSCYLLILKALESISKLYR
ncbi:hypothetical protein H5410_046774 [Solanum commersonii]|uniref:Uncharacterized protein n=1 Tax=Solanum commersonii TaxID=4109 RepID=A0A9J5XGF8_SOLCO|nr:hypothetical protein H5410_046774 [Solanum commersonii]